MTPLFIVFEGVDGAGTTTQCRILCERLRAEGHPVVATREPGGTPAGERIRQLVLDPALHGLEDVTELLLYGASRRQHVSEVIRPALEAGKPVISDRYALSTVAYQGVARGLGVDLVRQVNDLATDGLYPDLTIVLDLDVDTALRRRHQRDGGTPGDRLEQAGIEFQARVRQAYLDEAPPEAAVVLAADRPVDDLALLVSQTLIDRFPRFPYRIQSA